MESASSFFPMPWVVPSVAALVICLISPPSSGKLVDQSAPSPAWLQIIAEAEALGLPTKFLKSVPPDFVNFEFDDLQAFAAEYHLGEHRMVLNRTLSFNKAGGRLRPLAKLTHAEMETLYHELFHAYMDYLTTRHTEDEANSLLAFARKEQRCRYSTVLITPLVQRKTETEERFLSERESWEALNEGWAVFVGWTIWNQLELRQRGEQSIQKPGKSRDAWLRRLEEADREGKLRGYYEPEDPAERGMTRKRFLAPTVRLSKEEVERLMAEPMEFPNVLVKEAAALLTRSQGRLPISNSCK